MLWYTPLDALFGKQVRDRRGAFTGALTDRPGWFELGDNGTLLLDEVGDMPVNQQAKLLRAIEENAVVPVGAASPVGVNVRVVAATNVDLHEAVEQGRFRRDFLDRLEVLTLRLPPLWERAEDSPLLVEHFFALANQEEGTEVRPPGRADLAAMARTCDDLSIRVLKNVVRRLVVVKRRGRARCVDLAEAGLPSAAQAPPCRADVEVGRRGKVRVALEITDGMPFRATIAEVGRAVADAVLDKHGRCVSDAMRELAISKWLWYRVRDRQALK